MLRINGKAYWGDEASLQGWETKVGNFEILDARPRFRRYIAHKPFNVNLMEQHYDKIAQLARTYNVEPTALIKTHGKYYTFEKYINVFFLGQNPGLLHPLTDSLKITGSQKDLDTIQRVLDKGKLDKEILFNVEIKLWKGRMDSSSVIVDIKEPLKNVHASLFKDLDKILFTEGEAEQGEK